MHDPTRLSAQGGDRFLAHLLRAGAAERPRREVLEKTVLAASALGAIGALSTSAGASTAVSGTAASGTAASGTAVANSVATTAAATTTAAASGAVGAAGASAVLGKAATSALVITLAKWAGAGALALGVSSGARHWVDVADDGANPTPVTARTQPPAPAADVALVPRGELPSAAPNALGPGLQATEFTDRQSFGLPNAVAATASVTAPRSEAEASSLRVQAQGGDPRSVDPRSVDPRTVDPRGGDARQAQSGVRASAALGPAPDSQALAREISFVDRGRASLHTRAWNDVLSILTNYEASCPKQQLIVEVLVLRMEARLGLHQWSSARSLATRVLQLAGGAPQGARAREVLAQVSDL